MITKPEFVSDKVDGAGYQVMWYSTAKGRGECVKDNKKYQITRLGKKVILTHKKERITLDL